MNLNPEIQNLNAICMNIKCKWGGGQLCREISKFGYYNNLQITIKIVQKS